jgi:hypothetical protein
MQTHGTDTYPKEAEEVSDCECDIMSAMPLWFAAPDTHTHTYMRIKTLTPKKQKRFRTVSVTL